jgi:MFS family permease
MARNTIAILIGLLVLGALFIIIAVAAHDIVPGALERYDVDERPLLAPGAVAIVALLNAGAALIAGYLAAWIGRGEEIRNGLALGVGAGLLALLFALADYDDSPLLPVLWFVGPDDVPVIEALWYKVHLVVVPLPFALIGAYIRTLADHGTGP